MTNGISRRVFLGTGAVAAGALAMPGILKAQSGPIIIGHLTPRTGFLGPLGEYAVMAADLAVEEINAAGGVLGRQIRLVKEDSINPQTATTKAERMVERDNVAAIVGEISSASALTIGQVAQRTNRLFINTGANSDTLRSADCKRNMFHTEAQNVMYVNGEGEYLLANNLVKGKKWYMLSADYAFGHDLRKAAIAFLERNGGGLAGDELVPTDAGDFSSYMLKIRAAKPDVVILNLAGTQQAGFFKQYGEFGLDFPLGGFDFNTAMAWAAGAENFRGTWPCVWTHQVDTPESQRFSKAFTAKYGKPPENQAWSDYVAIKILAETIAKTGGTNTADMITYLESPDSQFEILKQRKGYFKKDTHQLMQEIYAVTALPPAQVKNKWDIFTTSGPIPAGDTPLDVLIKGQVGVCTFG